MLWCIGTLFKEECRYRILVRIGMTICIRQWGSPWGLSRSELRERRFFLCGDEDGGKNSRAGISGWGSGKKHTSPWIPRIRPLLYFLFFFIFEKSRYLFSYTLWDILVMSFVWLWIFCYTLWNVLAMGFCMIISNQMFLHCFFIINALCVVFVFFKRTWKYLFFKIKKGKNNVILLS
jgi:hypothetical protein